MNFPHQLTKELEAIANVLPTGWELTRETFSDPNLQGSLGGVAIGLSSVAWVRGGYSSSVGAANTVLEVTVLSKDLTLATAWELTFIVMEALECLGWKRNESIEDPITDFAGFFRPIVTTYTKLVQ